MMSGDKGMPCWIENVVLVGESYPTTLSKDSLSGIYPRNNRADFARPLQSLVGRLSPILKPIDGAPASVAPRFAASIEFTSSCSFLRLAQSGMRPPGRSLKQLHFLGHQQRAEL